MSPEANNPQGPQETQSLDTTIHPEGVRPFNAGKGDLVDVAPHLEVPQDPSVIDPVTRNVEFDKVEITPAPAATPEETKPWYQKTATKVAGGVLALTGIIAGGMAATGGNEPTETRNEPSVSASPEPGSAQGEGEAPDNTTGENPNENEPSPETPTTSEVVASVEKYPTAAEAIVPLVAQIEAYQNYFNTSSTPMTDEQRAEHEMMLEAVFGPHYADDTLSGFITNLKESWPEIAGYKSLTKQAIDAGYDEELFTLKTTVADVVQVGPNLVNFTALHDANFENNEIEENMDPAYAESIEKPLQVIATLDQVDGAWYIADWQTQ